MKIWVLLAFIVVLVLMGVRERFEATDNIKDPATWDETEYERIRNMVIPGSTLGNEELKNVVGGFFQKWKDATYRLTISDINTYLGTPPRASLPSDKKAEFRRVIEAYYIDQGQSVFERAANYVSGFMGEDTTGQYKPPVCPTGSTLANDGTGKCKYSDGRPPVTPTCPPDYNLTFDNPPRCRNPYATAPATSETAGTAGGTAPNPTCPSGSTLTDNSKTCYSKVDPTSPGVCPSGYTIITVAPDTADVGKCKKLETPTCPSGFMFMVEPPTGEDRSQGGRGVCKPSASTTTEPSGTTSATTAAATYDTTTGGSTSFYSQPTSGTGGIGQRIFGPAFTGRGEAGGQNATDSSQTTQYPQLLGGIFEPSTRIDGVGVVPPSKSWQLIQSGDLPSACSLGSEERSAFFPFSRCPGDKDLIPDPYRVSQTYSAASYGSKTEPVPFLTDFSAFFK